MTASPPADGPSATPAAPTTSAPNGAAAAAIAAAGVGAVALGLAIVLGEASATAARWFAFYEPVGSLGGKSTVATAVFVIAWLLLHFRWRSRVIDPGRILTTTLVLMALALLMTFPPFYTLFHATLP